MSKTAIEHFMDLKLPFFMILCLEKAVLTPIGFSDGLMQDISKIDNTIIYYRGGILLKMWR